MKILFLDCYDVNPGDIDWTPISNLGEFHCWNKSTREEAIERINLHNADTVMVDSMQIDSDFIDSCPSIRHIAVAATGTDNIDIAHAKVKNIAVTNVPAYSTDAVAQHAIALLLEITNKVNYYDDHVKGGQWKEDTEFIYKKAPLTLLNGKSIGIIGYGNIGRQVGKIAEAFGMKVYPYSKYPDLAVKSDVISLNCPLTDKNRKMIDDEFISRMKDGAIIINTARGGLIDEEALAKALKSGKIAAAGLDVLAEEPPEASNILLELPNCFVTPHIAFAPYETRQSILDICAENIKSLERGEKLNRLDCDD